jgi:hypothetical protein
LLVALLSRFADALIQSERENQERLRLHLAQAREKMASHGACAVEPGPAEPPVAQAEHLP